MTNSLHSFMHNYINAFSKGETKNIIPYYSFPITIVDQYDIKNNAILVIKNIKQFKDYFSNLYKVLKNFYRYKKTKITKIVSINENKNFSTVKVIALRLNYKNEKFQKIELTYYLKKVKNEYRIFCFVV